MFHRIKWVASIAPIALLAACGEDAPSPVVEATDISAVEMGALIGGSNLLEPGLYQVAGSIETVGYPHLESDNAEARAIIQLIRRGLIEAGQLDLETCLAEGAPFDPRGQQAGDCRVPTFRLDGNAVTYTATCATPDGLGEATADFTGTLAGESYTLNSLTTVQSQPGPNAELRDVTMNAQFVGTRVGDCS